MCVLSTRSIESTTNESSVWNGELSSVFGGDLEGKEIQNRGDIWIRIADSLCCTVESNTAL